MKELHQVKILVKVTKVNINIKFPCSIKVQIKTDPDKQITSNAYQLKNGQCQPNQMLELDIQSIYDTQKTGYQSSQVTVLAIISSSNSNFPAGSVVINPFMYSQGQQIQKIQLLQKCSDRQAKITLYSSYKMIKKIKDIEPIKSLKTVQSVQNRIGSMKSHLSKGIQHLQLNNNRQGSRQKSLQKSEVDQLVSESRVRQFGQVSIRPYKDYVRQKDKNKIFTNETNQRRQNALKGQVEILSLQVQKYKQKMRNYQRKQKQYNLIIKDLKDNVQKKKIKFMQSESSKSSIQITLNQKEKYIKQLKQQIKKISQKIQDFKIQNNRLQKKIQIKQKSYDQQIKMLTDKLTQLQKQISRKTYESNAFLEKMQISQKNNQIANKQKQKANTQQKNRLIKKIQQLNHQIQNTNQVNQDKQTKLQTISSQLKSVTQQNINRINLIQRLQSELQISKTQLKNQKQNKFSLQKQIQLLLSAQTDKNIFKKKYNQTSQLLNKLNQKHERTTLNLNQLQTKLNQCQQKNKQMSKIIKQLNQQIINLNTQLQNIKKQNSNLSNQFNSLSAKHLNLTQKLNDTKSKLDLQKEDLQQMQAHYQDKLNYLSKSKQYVQNEAQDWKDKYQKIQQVNIQLQSKSRIINDQLLNKHKQILQLQQNNKKLQYCIQQQQSRIKRLSLQNQTWQRKQKQLQQSVKLKGNDLYDLQRKVSLQQQQLYILKQKIQTLTKSNQQLNSLLQTTVQQKDKQINSKINQFQYLKTQYNQLQQVYDDLLIETNSKKKQIMIQQDQIKQYVQTIDTKNHKIISLQSIIQSNKSQILSLQQQSNIIKNKYLQVNLNYQELNGNFTNYKNSTQKALQQFIDQICKDSTTIDVQLYKFQDSSLQNMQITALHSKNEIINKYRSKVSFLQQNIQFYKKQIQKIKQLHINKQLDLESQILNLQNKITQLNLKQIQQKQELNELSNKIQQQKQSLNTQIQKHKSNINKLQQIIQQLSQQKLLVQNELQNTQNEVVILKQQLLQIKSNTIKQKSNVQIYFKDYKQQTQQQIQNYKKNQIQNTQKLLLLQKQKQYQQNHVQQIQTEIQNIKIEIQKQITKRSQCQHKIKQLQRQLKQLKSNLNNKQNTISDLHNIINNQKSEIKAFIDKILLLQTQRKQIYQQLTQTIIKKQQLSIEIVLSNQHNTKLKQQLSELQIISSSTSQQKDIQIKQQKDKITKLQSELQLKLYILCQLEKVKQNNSTQIKQSYQELENKKQQLIIYNKQIENLKNHIFKIQENTSNNSLEIQSLKQQNSLNIDKIIQLQTTINQLTPKAEELIIKIQEMEMMKNCIIQLQNQKHKISLQYKSVQNEIKNINNKNFTKQQDYRKKVQSLQIQIQQKILINKQNSQKFYSEWEKQKSSLMKQLQQQDKLLRQQQQQNKFIIEQLQQQRNSLNNQCEQLSYMCDEKDQQIQRIIKQYEQSQNKISELNLELKACLQAWDKQKLSYMPSRKQITDLQQEMGKFQQYTSQIDTKTKQLIEISRRKSAEQSKFGITDVIKDLSSTILKSKNKMLNKIQSEQQKQSILNQYKILQDKLDNAIKSTNIIYK